MSARTPSDGLKSWPHTLHTRLHARLHTWCCEHLPAHIYDPHRQGWGTRFKRSLYLRLVAIFILLAVAMSFLVVTGSRQVFAAGWRQIVQPLLMDYADRLTTDIGSPPDIARARAITERLPLAIQIDGPVVNWSSRPLPNGVAVAADAAEAADGSAPGTTAPEASVRSTGSNGATGSPRATDAKATIEPRQEQASTVTAPREALRSHDAMHARQRGELTRLTADGHRVRFSVADFNSSAQPRRMLWLTLSALLLLLLLSFVLVRKVFRPLDDIRVGVLRYGEGRFDQPIPVRRRDELGDLAGHVNQMAASLGRMLESQRGLLLAISHELRSPLTRARLNAEMVGDGPERDALLRDLAQMRDLISDLLESERLAGDAAALNSAPTDLNQLVRTLVDTQFTDQAVTLRLDENLTPVALDATRVALLLRNLLDNALKHGAEAAKPPEVSTEWLPDTQGWRLRVRDHGAGLPDEQLARLGEAFYRPDSARTRRAGGVGLGLYLCKLVASSHGGSLTLRNAGPGLEVVLEVPAPV